MNDIQNRRILIIDDNQAIHDDFRKILCGRNPGTDELAATETSLFGDTYGDPAMAFFEVDSAFQGHAGVACVQHALDAGRPYALAFIDVRMPPGLDGIETTERIWKVDPDLQIVICTAYSDYSWSEVVARIGQSDRLVVLKKPFDNIEVSQLALALTKKWRLAQQARHKVDELEEMVRERTLELLATNESLRSEITERKRAEQALHENREHYRILIESQGEGVVITDLDRRFTFANPAAETIMGVWPGQLVGKTLDEFVDGKNQAVLQEQIELRRTGKKTSYEIEINAASGERRQILITGTPQKDGAGGFCGSFAVFRDITKRKQAERALRESQHSLKAILDNIPDPAWLKDAQGRYQIGNKSLAGIYKCRLEEIVGKTVFEVFPECAAALAEGDAKITVSSKPVRSECMIPDADGRNRWFDAIETPIFNEKNELAGMAGIARDVTERKEMEATLRESEVRYRSLFENMLEGCACCRMIFDQDQPQDFEYLDVNTAFEELTGLKNVIGKKATEVIPSIRESDPGLFEIYGRVARSGKPEKFEIYVKSLGIWFSIAVFSYQKDHFVAIFDNVTERKTLEQKNNDTRIFLDRIINSVADPIFVLDRQCRIVIINDANCNLMQRRRDEVVGKSVYDLFPKWQADIFRIQSEMVFTTGKENINEENLTDAGGNIHTIVTKKTLYTDEKGAQYLVGVIRDITDRKRMEEDLRQKTALFEAMVHSSLDGILVVNEQGQKVVQNPQFTELVRIPKEIAEQASDAEQLQFVTNSVRDPEQFFGKVRHLNSHPEETSRDEIEFKDGRILDRYSAPVLDGKGNYHGRIWMFREITGRKRMEQALRESENRYRELLDSQDDGVVMADEDQRFAFVNPAFGKILGLPPEQLLGRTLQEFLDEEQINGFRHQVELRKQGRKSTYELTVVSATGEHRQVLINATPQMNRHGRFCGTFAVLRDITERKRTEEKLHLQTSALAATANGIAITDRTGLILWVNPAFTRLTGYDSSEAIGKTPALLKSGAQDRTFYQNLWDTILSGKVWQGCLVNRRKDGSLYHEDMTITPVLDEKGEVLNFVAVKQDVSERKRAEEALQRQQTELRVLFDLMPAMIWFKDTQNGILRVNQRVAQAAGKSIAEIEGKPSLEIYPQDAAKFYADDLKVIRSGTPKLEIVETIQDREGKELWVQTDKVPVHDKDGKVVGIVVMAQNITERKQAEQSQQMMELQLRQAQKMEAIGQLAAGIAHEINTPTQYVGDNTRFLKDAFNNVMSVLRSHGELLAAAKQNTLTPELLEHVEDTLMASDLEYLTTQIPQAIQETLEGVERVTKIVRAMKEFSHPGGKEKSAADLNKAVESTTTVARNEWKYVSDLKLDLDPELPLVPCFIGEFNQVILNLVVNAAHAIGDVVKQHPNTKGTITIRTRRDGDSVEIRVSDTGTGIPEIHRRRIFEPFFTTKDVGRGSGQGLPLVYSTIVKKHGGSVTFETEVGNGTTFIIRLPVYPPKKSLEKAADTPAEMALTP